MHARGSKMMQISAPTSYLIHNSLIAPRGAEDRMVLRSIVAHSSVIGVSLRLGLMAIIHSRRERWRIARRIRLATR